MLYYDNINISKGINIAKSNNSMIFIISFLITDPNFKILYGMVAMI